MRIKKCIFIFLIISSFFRIVTGQFSDPGDFGFSPDSSGIVNMKALQKAIDKTGTIVVSQPGIYKMAGTVYIGSNTSLIFDSNVFLKKVDEQGSFSHVIVNKGALTKTYDEHISVEGLNIIVNGMDVRTFREAYGLHGQLAFDNIRVLHDQPTEFLSIGTPVDVLTICNSSLRNNRINFHGNKAMPDYLKTKINIYGCVFNKHGVMDLVTNSVPGKEIFLKTSSNLELNDDFSAKVIPGPGNIQVDSDLTGLKR